MQHALDYEWSTPVWRPQAREWIPRQPHTPDYEWSTPAWRPQAREWIPTLNTTLNTTMVHLIKTYCDTNTMWISFWSKRTNAISIRWSRSHLTFTQRTNIHVCLRRWIMNDLLLLDDLRHVNEFLHSTLRWRTSSKHIVTSTQCEYRFDPKGLMQSTFSASNIRSTSKHSCLLHWEAHKNRNLVNTSSQMLWRHHRHSALRHQDFKCPHSHSQSTGAWPRWKASLSFGESFTFLWRELHLDEELIVGIEHVDRQIHPSERQHSKATFRPLWKWWFGPMTLKRKENWSALFMKHLYTTHPPPCQHTQSYTLPHALHDLLLLDDLRHVNEFLHSTLRWRTSSKHIVTSTQCEYRFDPKGLMQSTFSASNIRSTSKHSCLLHWEAHKNRNLVNTSSQMLWRHHRHSALRHQDFKCPHSHSQSTGAWPRWKASLSFGESFTFLWRELHLDEDLIVGIEHVDRQIHLLLNDNIRKQNFGPYGNDALDQWIWKEKKIDLHYLWSTCTQHIHHLVNTPNLIHFHMHCVDLLLLDDLRHVNEFLHSTLRWRTSSKHIVTSTQCEYRFDPKGLMQSTFSASNIRSTSKHSCLLHWEAHKNRNLVNTSSQMLWRHHRHSALRHQDFKCPHSHSQSTGAWPRWKTSLSFGESFTFLWNHLEPPGTILQLLDHTQHEFHSLVYNLESIKFFSTRTSTIPSTRSAAPPRCCERFSLPHLHIIVPSKWRLLTTKNVYKLPQNYGFVLSNNFDMLN